MNAFAPLAGMSVRTADLSDADECRRIDAFAAAHAAAQPFHRASWTRAVERGTGQKGRYLIAERKSGDIVGILPLSEISSPLFGSALVSAGFGVGGGIVADDEGAVQALADSAIALAGELGCKTTELRGGALPEGWRRQEGIYAGFARTLPGDEESILKSIPRKQRAEVRRALGFDLKITVGTGAADRRNHYRCYSESVRNLGTPVFPRALFDAVLDEWRDDADILTVSRGGKPLASVLNLYSGGTVYPYWGGGTREARTWRANELMYFALMRHGAARGCTRFDFGRSKLGTGAFAFKKNWGFEPEPLVYAVRGPARDINPLNPKYRMQIALWQKLPLWLANRLGPPIARGLG